MTDSTTAAATRPLVVHDWLTGMRGGEQVLEEVLQLLPSAELATLFHLRGSVSAAIEERSIQTSPLQHFPGLKRRYRYYLPLFPLAVERIDTRGCDPVVSISHSVAKGVRTDPGAYHLCYCNSPMRYVWDQRRVYFPDTDGLVAKARERLLNRLQAWDVATANRVDFFVANSSFVAARIARAYGVDAQVVHPPVGIDDLRPRGPVDDDGYLITVSALVPYKRLDLAVDIAANCRRPLIIVGDGPERQRLSEHAAAVADRVGVDVRLLGRVDRIRLVELLQGATAFLQPGVEDFGISSVEALAAGVPVVARGRGGIKDILQRRTHGVLVEDEDLGEWAAAIDTASKMRSNYLDRVARAEDFSPARFRTQIDDILKHRPRSRTLERVQPS